jgi:hypothetical protein
MTTLSYEYVYSLARSVGLTKSQATIATAVAAAESGLNPNNIGDQTLAKYGSRGLWQIFTGAHSASELGLGSGGWTSALVKKLEDPKNNAHAMYLISNKGTNWHPWSTFQHDSHLKFMSKATAAAEKVGDQWSSILNPPTPTPSPTPPPTPSPPPGPKTPMANKPSVSLAKAKAESKLSKAYQAGLCLQHVNNWLNTPHLGGDAATSWAHAKHKHTDSNPPAGAPVFWTGGSSGHGHIALSEGGGKISTTDYPRTGHTGTGVSIHMPKDHWGLHYAGWSEDLNGVSIPGLVTEPTVDPIFTKKLGSKVAPGGHDPQVADLQRLLVLAGFGPISGTPPYTPFYGGNTEEAVARYLAKYPAYASRAHDVAIGPKGYANLQKLALKAKKG